MGAQGLLALGGGTEEEIGVTGSVAMMSKGEGRTVATVSHEGEDEAAMARDRVRVGQPHLRFTPWAWGFCGRTA